MEEHLIDLIKLVIILPNFKKNIVLKYTTPVFF